MESIVYIICECFVCTLLTVIHQNNHMKVNLLKCLYLLQTICFIKQDLEVSVVTDAINSPSPPHTLNHS